MLLELKNIKKHYLIKKGFLSSPAQTVRAVDGVSLSIHRGESVGLVGESGCGKTTLARIVVRLIDLGEGQIVFEGKDVTKISGHDLKEVRKNIQMVFQDPYSSLDPRFTIRQVLHEGMTLKRQEFLGKEEERIQEFLAAVQLRADILNRYPHEFSGGERQRIAIARALILNPQLLILDEAVSSLDALVQEEILNLLKDLHKKLNLTYLFISHNLKVVKKITQKVAVMYKGKIVELAKTEELFENPLHPYTKELLSSAMQYKSIAREEDIAVDSSKELVELKPGHFVLS